MELVKLEVFSSQTNSAIVRMPGRTYPGVVIQGDTLSIFHSAAEKLLAELKNANSPLVDDAQELEQLLKGHLVHYEAVLRDHGIGLPYTRGRS